MCPLLPVYGFLGMSLDENRAFHLMGVQTYSRGERRLHSNYPSKRSEHREPAATVHPFMGDFLIAGHGESSAFRVVNTRSTICPLQLANHPEQPPGCYIAVSATVA